jgi:hypothetical protein
MMHADTAAAIVEHALAVSNDKTITLTRDAADVLARGYRTRHERAAEAERVLLAIGVAITRPGERVGRELPYNLADLIHPVAILCREAWDAREKKP